MAARGARGLVLVLLLTSLLAYPPSLAAQQVRYEYDALGRLTLVSTPEGVAIYEYDAVGNILRITVHRYRETSGPVALLAMSPDRGAPGTVVTLYGRGFATSGADNQVAFNGVAATVTAVTGTTLTTVVPPGATTGPVTLTTAQGTATSPSPFTVLTFTVVPAEASVVLGGTLGFQALLGGATLTDLTWRVNGVVGGDATLGTISQAGLYTAPATLPPTQPLQIEARRGADPAQTATARLHVVSQVGGLEAAAPVTVGRGAHGAPVVAGPLTVGVAALGGPQASAPLSVTAGPVLEGIDPASVPLGSAPLPLTLSGRNLQGAYAVRLLREGQVDPQLGADAVSAAPDGTRVTCTLTIRAGVAPGPRVLQVLTSQGTSTDVDQASNRVTLTAP